MPRPSLFRGETHSLDVLPDPQTALTFGQRLAVDRDVLEGHVPDVVLGVGAFELDAGTRRAARRR